VAASWTLPPRRAPAAGRLARANRNNVLSLRRPS